MTISLFLIYYRFLQLKYRAEIHAIPITISDISITISYKRKNIYDIEQKTTLLPLLSDTNTP